MGPPSGGRAERQRRRSWHPGRCHGRCRTGTLGCLQLRKAPLPSCDLWRQISYNCSLQLSLSPPSFLLDAAAVLATFTPPLPSLLHFISNALTPAAAAAGACRPLCSPSYTHWHGRLSASRWLPPPCTVYAKRNLRQAAAAARNLGLHSFYSTTFAFLLKRSATVPTTSHQPNPKPLPSKPHTTLTRQCAAAPSAVAEWSDGEEEGRHAVQSLLEELCAAGSPPHPSNIHPSRCRSVLGRCRCCQLPAAPPSCSGKRMRRAVLHDQLHPPPRGCASAAAAAACSSCCRARLVLQAPLPTLPCR